jgi:hypothetical protein
MNAIKKRRAGVAVDAGDRSEGAFYCPVQGGGGGVEYSGPASQIAEIVDAFPWLEIETAIRARRVLGDRDAPRDDLRQLRARFRGAFHAWLQTPIGGGFADELAFHGVARDARTRMRLSFCLVLLSSRDPPITGNQGH